MSSALALHALHAAVYVAIRLRPPLEAAHLAVGFASKIPRLTSVESARVAMDRLGRLGTCLSRALTIAACLPDSEVVIGVMAGERSGTLAHAWVEVGGCALRAHDVAGREIARIPVRLNGSRAQRSNG